MIVATFDNQAAIWKSKRFDEGTDIRRLFIPSDELNNAFKLKLIDCMNIENRQKGIMELEKNYA